MNYFNLLTDLSIKHTVWLKTVGSTWTVEVLDWDKSMGHYKSLAKVEGETPEQAIRRAYLAVYPVKKNTNNGKLKQTA